MSERMVAKGNGDRQSRILIPEIAARLAIGRMTVYEMLERRIIPGIRLGRRWIVTRHAYEQWEQTCGIQEPLPTVDRLQ